MDDSTNTITGKNSNGSNVVPTNLQRSSNPVTQRQQQFLGSHRKLQDILNFNLDQLFPERDNYNNHPVIIRREILTERLLKRVRMHATMLVDFAGAEVAIVVLFQIMQNNNTSAREGGGAAETEVEEEEEHDETPTSMFEIICVVFGKEKAMEIVNDMLNNKTMNIITALVLATTQYRKGKVQRECVYYVLRKQHELTHMYCNLMETTILRNDRSIERGLITIFMTTLPNKEDNNSTTLFQNACHGLGRNTVVETIEDILQQQQRTTSSSSLSSRSSVNTMLALVSAATLNDNNDHTHSVHVDGIYFMLRRQPDVLLRCSSKQPQYPH